MNVYFVAVRTLFVKATLYFPSCDLLWMFKEQTQGFNLHVRPKQNTLTGLFQETELQKAVRQFQANYTEAGRFLLDYNEPSEKESAPDQDLRRDSA